MRIFLCILLAFGTISHGAPPISTPVQSAVLRATGGSEAVHACGYGPSSTIEHCQKAGSCPFCALIATTEMTFLLEAAHPLAAATILVWPSSIPPHFRPPMSAVPA